jgi:hypothetical protein
MKETQNNVVVIFFPMLVCFKLRCTFPTTFF